MPLGVVCHRRSGRVISMFAKLARVVTRQPWWVIAGWLVAAAAIVATAPSISSITVDDQAAFLPASAESARAAALARDAFPQTPASTAVVVVQRSDRGPLTDPDVQRVVALATGLAAAPVPGAASGGSGGA